jgi:hypothetical protein
MERLLELLEDQRMIRLLDATNDRNSLTWDSVFLTAHRLILKVESVITELKLIV